METRSILAVHFDKEGNVEDIRHFGLKDGHVVAFETRETPAKGKELTFLQQLFNATPGVPIGSGGPGGGQNPGGGGPLRRSEPHQRKTARSCERAFFISSDQTPCASVASSNSATMLVILIIGLTAGPAVSL